MKQRRPWKGAVLGAVAWLLVSNNSRVLECDSPLTSGTTAHRLPTTQQVARSSGYALRAHPTKASVSAFASA
jgi:hypothetical protein